MEIKSRKCFTLAETLVVIGIIGVIAAIVIPNLVASYQKQATVSRLKEDYSILNQALMSAAAEQGTTFGSLFIHDTIPLAQPQKDFVNSFVQTNILPYIAIAKDCGWVNYTTCKMQNFNLLNGNSRVDEVSYKLFIKNGSSFSFILDNDGTNYTSMIVRLDINGNQKPNIIGKDVFMMRIDSNEKKLVFFNSGAKRYFLLNDSTYGCNKSSSGWFCGALIMQDGWEIKDDYPW